MKKIFALILAMAMVLALCACGSKKTDTVVPTDEPQTSETVDGDTTQTPEASKDPQSDATQTPTTQKPSTQKPAPTKKPAATQKPSGGAATPAKTVSELTSMMDKVIKGADEVMMPATSEVTKDSFKYIVGIDYVDGYTAVVYQPQVSSSAFQIVLFSAPSGADISSLASQIKANADPNKWVCVTADAVDAVVKGNVVLFYMIDTGAFPNTVSAITGNFAKLG